LGGGIEFKLVAKTWACKKNSFYKFSQFLLENVWVDLRSFMLSCPPRGGKIKHH
jgi:hypothetical protein